MAEQPISEQLVEGTIIANRFKILQKLGAGACGSVFKVVEEEEGGAKDQVAPKLYALKAEYYDASQSDSILKMEVQILEKLKKKKHVLQLIYSAKRPEFSYMVMTLLGESLGRLVEKFGPYFNASTQLRIGIMLLYGVKQIHDIGYIHRDLKPANVALGYPGSDDERMMLILDFGLAREYITKQKDGKILLRRPRDRAFFRGTSRYCSIAMHERTEQGRVDDLWGLCYILAELRAKLPWADIYEKEDIAMEKKATLDERLFLNSPVQLLEFVKEVRKLNYYDHPNYEKLFKILSDSMNNAGYRWKDPYHWEIKKKGDNSGDRNPKNPKLKSKSKFVTMSEKLIKSRRTKSAAPAAKKKESCSDKMGKTKALSVNSSPNIAGATADVPFFTSEDFTSNPIGF